MTGKTHPGRFTQALMTPPFNVSVHKGTDIIRVREHSITSHLRILADSSCRS